MRGYLIVIRTHTTFSDPNPWVRWQADIPSGYPYTHRSITPTCENRVTCGDTQGLSIHTFMLPQPVRCQVACGDALYGNPHTFWRQKCLQSLHAFKGDNVFTSKTSISFSPVLRRTQRPLFVRFKKKKTKRESENENENELNEKRRNFNIFMPSRVLLLGFTLVVGRVKIQLEWN